MFGNKWNLFVFFSVFLINVYTKAKPINQPQLIRKISTQTRTPRSDIIFIDDDTSTELFPRLKGPPPCAEDTTFCENFYEYPYNHVQNILKNYSLNKAVFGMDTPPDIATRDEESDRFVCKSRISTVFPKIGKNINNDWRIIINQGNEEGYVQGVVVETCVGKRKKCEILGDIMNDYITTCKQKYIYRRLFSLSDEGKPIQDTFMLPSACCCTYRRNFDNLFRFEAYKSND